MKEIFYNGLVDLYKKTGQGCPKNMINADAIINELLAENLIKIVVKKYKHLPEDTWICLSNVYCIEEDTNKDSLTFMRIYLGIEDLGLNLKRKNIIKDDTFMLKYSKWIEEHKEDLSKMKDVKLLDVPKQVKCDLNSSELSYIMDHCSNETLENSFRTIEQHILIYSSISKLYDASKYGLSENSTIKSRNTAMMALEKIKQFSQLNNLDIKRTKIADII